MSQATANETSDRGIVFVLLLVRAGEGAPQIPYGGHRRQRIAGWDC